MAWLHSWQHHWMGILILWECSLKPWQRSTHRKRYASFTTVQTTYCTASHCLDNTSSYKVYTIIVAQIVPSEPTLTACFCSQRGWTALHLAAQEGKIDVVRLLTEAKAKVNIQTKVYMHNYIICLVFTPTFTLTSSEESNIKLLTIVATIIHLYMYIQHVSIALYHWILCAFLLMCYACMIDLHNCRKPYCLYNNEKH